MAKKERRDYTIAGLPFYQTELVMGQVELIHEIETQARKSGCSTDATDEEKYGDFIVRYGVSLLSVALIPGDESQDSRFQDEDQARASVKSLKAWLRGNLEATDIPRLVSDFFVFSLRSTNPTLRALPLPNLALDVLKTQAIG